MNKDPLYVNQLKDIGRTLQAAGLVASAEGNISLRAPSGEIYISCRGARLGEMEDRDVAVLDAEDGIPRDGLQPTSEYLLHTLVYSRHPDIRVVIHTHGAHATAAAVIREDVPPVVDEMTILLGGGLAVAEYAPPGSRLLAENTLAALGDKKAALLANHGAVALGTTLEDAVKNALLTENVCRVYLLAKTAGTVHQITPEAFASQREIYLSKRGVL